LMGWLAGELACWLGWLYALRYLASYRN